MNMDNDDGTLREYKEPYATVDCATKEDFEFIKKAVEFYKKMQWIPAENPPEVDEEGYSECILLNFANAAAHEIGQWWIVLFKLRNFCRCLDAVAGTIRGVIA